MVAPEQQKTPLPILWLTAGVVIGVVGGFLPGNWIALKSVALGLAVTTLVIAAVLLLRGRRRGVGKDDL